MSLALRLVERRFWEMDPGARCIWREAQFIIALCQGVALRLDRVADVDRANSPIGY